MSEEIIKVLDELGKRFGIVIDWSNQNIIPYLQELVKRFICYRNITGCVWIIISIIPIILGVIGIKLLNKWKKSDKYCDDFYSDDGFFAALGYIASIFIIMLGIGIIIGNILGIIKNIYIPELVIYKYIKTIQ